MGRSQPSYDSYETYYDREQYYEEINYPGSTEITEQQFENNCFPTGPVYDEYESDLGESQGEEEEETKEKHKGKFSSCPEPIHE